MPRSGVHNQIDSPDLGRSNGLSGSEDTVAADNFVPTILSGDTVSWRGHTDAQRVIGGTCT
jgi:hypothetical protein